MKIIISLIITFSFSYLGWAEPVELTNKSYDAQAMDNLENPAFDLNETAASTIDWEWWKKQGENIIGAGWVASQGAKLLLNYVAPVVGQDLLQWVKTYVPSMDAANYLFNTLYSAYQSTTKWTTDKVMELSASIVEGLATKYMLPVLNSAAKSALDTILKVLFIR